MAHQLTAAEQERYTRIFMELDTDRNGWLSREEVGSWLRGSGYKLTEQQVERIFRMIDKNEDGKISLDEFYQAMQIMKKQPNRTSDLLKVFKAMDTNGDGFLSEIELFRGMTSCGHDVTREQVRQFVVKLDKNHDGQVDFEEFTAAFKNS